MAKKKGSDSAIVWLAVGVIAILAAIPKELWIGFGVLGVIGAVVYFWSKKSPSSRDATITRKVQSQPQRKRPGANKFAEEDRLVSIRVRDNAYEENDYKIPSKPRDLGSSRWLRLGESVVVAGVNLTGGLIYVGTSLPTPHGENDPCLIDPNKSVALRGDFTQPAGGYWPSYSSISKEARKAYLNWLSEGRNNPSADIGYVFLYFYGLERRVVLDAAKDSSLEKELPDIANEIRRLLRTYGDKSGSFKRYATELLNWIEVSSFNPKLYLEPVPIFTKTWELPLYLRLALGRAAMDGVPIPPALALAWVKLDPAISLRTPATRCVEEFDKLFLLRYQREFGGGISLPRNKTKLKFVYRPASSGFHGYNEIKLGFGDTPDVTVLTAPLGKLRRIVDEVTNELDSYSRFLARGSNQANSLDAMLLLPAEAWPDKLKQALDSLKKRMGGGLLAMSFSELLNSFEKQAQPTKDKVLGLAKALEALDIGMEPNVLHGATPPSLSETVVLFPEPRIEPHLKYSPAYQAALLTLQLSAVVANADGDFSAQELTRLTNQIQTARDLTSTHKQRLKAHLRLLHTTPVSLPALKKRLDLLEQPAKDTLASFMAAVAQADGDVSPDEIKMLEKIYKALGVEPKKVFGDIHTAATSESKTEIIEHSAPKVENAGFKLDTARIAELQKDTEKVSALLSSIFREEEVLAPVLIEEKIITENEESSSVPSLLGLDESHSSLARLLLSRPEWTREELLDVAADLDLMLDGALEHINEAAFDAYDSPLTEGEGPITVNIEVLEKLET